MDFDARGLLCDASVKHLDWHEGQLTEEDALAERGAICGFGKVAPLEQGKGRLLLMLGLSENARLSARCLRLRKLDGSHSQCESLLPKSERDLA